MPDTKEYVPHYSIYMKFYKKHNYWKESISVVGLWLDFWETEGHKVMEDGDVPYPMCGGGYRTIHLSKYMHMGGFYCL